MSDSILTDYVTLIGSFVSKEIGAEDFEKQYLKMFKTQSGFLPNNIFKILDGLFGDVDAFCADPELCDEDNLNEEQLREKCARALKQLHGLIDSLGQSEP
jgi:hypothetical protein